MNLIWDLSREVIKFKTTNIKKKRFILNKVRTVILGLNHFYLCVFINCFINFCFSVIWYRKPSGKEIAMIQGYTFSLDGRNKTTDKYKCCQSPRCKARFFVTKNRKTLKSSNLNHNHPPSKYVIRNGVYIKI